MATSSGGFVARADRGGALSASRTSLEHVGPGTYNPSLGPPSPSSAMPAPFSTTAERVLVENTTTSKVTPGPGAYQAAQAKDALKQRHAESLGFSAAFASNTARLHTDKSSMGKPGPGHYPEGNAWIKNSHHYSASPSKQRVNFKRVPSAPSIPARGQSYGYEEGTGGTLVMQQPQDPIHTGVGHDKVGPGAYELAAAMPPKPHAVQWGASRTKRGMQIKSETPGPGHYQLVKDTKAVAGGGIVVSINGVDVQFGGASGTAQFASRVPNAAGRGLQAWERTPGPGAYDLAKPMGAAPLPRELQFFGSSTVRKSALDPTRSHAAPTYMRTPGPGAYNPPAKAITIMQQSLTEPRPFNATSNRFGSDDNGVPGPGEYRPDQVVSLVKGVVDKAAVQRAVSVFGSTAQRFVPGGPGKGDTIASAMGGGGSRAGKPGPGAYDPKPDLPKPPHKGYDAAFSSTTDRFRAHTAPAAAPDLIDYEPESGEPPRGDPSRVGPGAYTLPDPWSKKGKAVSYRKPAFGSDAGRSGLVDRRSLSNPGPGRYNTTKDVAKSLKPITNPAPESIFGSQVPRFKGGMAYAPGPGHYNVAGDLTRKSYNVTYHGVAVA